jgi:hypothetical protein
VLSGRGLCDELITIPEESYRLWCFVVCDVEASWMRRPWPTRGCRTQKSKQTNKQTEQISPQVTTTTCIYWVIVRISLLENPQLSLMFFAVLIGDFLKIRGQFPETVQDPSLYSLFTSLCIPILPCDAICCR